MKKEKLIDIIESNKDWYVEDYSENNSLNLLIGGSSPEGEDISFEVKGDSIEEIIQDIKRYVNSFDIDEHVELWVDSRGKNGVPNSIKDLVTDAEAIKEMYDNLLNDIENVL